MAIIENPERTALSVGRRPKLSNEDLIKEMETKADKITERIMSRKPPCPIDGKVSKWDSMLGWRGDALYICPDGHEFAMKGEAIKIVKG